jgi:hypothetical protein
MHDVAVGDDIVLAFEAELAGIARASGRGATAPRFVCQPPGPSFMM